MKKNKLKLIMAAVSISILFSITGCSSSASNNTETKSEKLALSKANVQKVFADKYEVGSYSSSSNSIQIDFNTITNIPKNKARETLKKVEDTLHKNFNIGDENVINIFNDQNILIRNVGGEIQIEEKPIINIESPIVYDSTYSMSTKFNLLNPFENVEITATDKEDGDLTSKIKLKNPEILTKIGVYQLNYEVTDSDGNIVNNDELKINVKK